MCTQTAFEYGLTPMEVDDTNEILLARVKPDSIIAARLSAGVRWYQAKLLYVHRYEVVDVRFINYGNDERVTGKDLRRLGDAGSLSTPTIATGETLAKVAVPGKDDLNGVADGKQLQKTEFVRQVVVAVMASETNSRVAVTS